MSINQKDNYESRENVGFSLITVLQALIEVYTLGTGVLYLYASL